MLHQPAQEGQMFFYELSNEIAALQTKYKNELYALITGDFNARTAELPDCLDVHLGKNDFLPIDHIEYRSKHKITEPVSMDKKTTKCSGYCFVKVAH